MSQPGTLSAEMAAKLIMVTDRHLRRLVADGWVVKTPDDKYSLVETVQGYIRHLQDINKRASQSASRNKASEARAREIGLRIAERERELVKVGEAMLAIDTLAGHVRTVMQGLPARMTRNIEERERYERIINDELLRLSKLLTESAHTARTGELPYEASAEDDTGGMGESE